MSYLNDFVELVDAVPHEMKATFAQITKLDTEATGKSATVASHRWLRVSPCMWCVECAEIIDKKAKKFFREGKHSQQQQRKTQQVEEVQAVSLCLA